MSEIKIVEYSKADKSSCIELLKNIFPGASDENTFQWRFESNLRHSPILICAKDRDKVVSFNSWLPWEFVYGDKIYLGYQSGESGTYQEYRRRGIWGNVLSYMDEIVQKRNIDFLFGFPSHMSYSQFYKSGYYPIGIFPYHLRLFNPLGITIAEKTGFGFDETPKHIITEYNKITPITDADYFNWRYRKNPKSYSILKYTENNNQAIFILRLSTYYNKKYHIRIKELLLLDCHFTSYNEIFISNAFKHIDKTYRRKAAFLRGFIGDNTDRGRAISNFFHFKITSRFETLCIKPAAKEIDWSVFFNHNNWDILPHVVDEM